MNAVSFATWVAMKRMLGLEETPSREKRRREQE